jgi:hypothetical protein|tara:strand:+ start:59 stop:595 length:537 start_codon:yes stop_codon:yes gene_type:complete
MINIKLTDKIRQYAINKVTIKNFGQRSAGFNGKRTEQYTGILGECVLHEVLDRPWPTYVDGNLLEDLIINNCTVDVKTMARTVDIRDFYVHNFVGYQKDRPCDVLLFNSINKNTRTTQICGWIPKKEFLEKADFFPKGSTQHRANGTSFITEAPLHTLQQKFLNQINNVDDINSLTIS